MKKIEIAKSVRSPYVCFDPEKGSIVVRGQSILENPREFFEALVGRWLDEYLKAPQEETNVEIDLEFCNTSSSVWIFQLLNKVSKLRHSGKNVKVYWVYADDDVLDIGNDYSQCIGMEFLMVKKVAA